MADEKKPAEEHGGSDTAWIFLTMIATIVFLPFIILYKMFNHSKKNPSLFYKFIFGKLEVGSHVIDVNSWGISRGLVLSIVFLGLLLAISTFIPHFPSFLGAWILGLAPLWVPVGLYTIAKFIWVHATQEQFIANTDPILLEVKIPRDIMKSPRAMEVALTQLFHGGGETTYADRGWLGKVRTWFSLELVSTGGVVHFYVWTWKRFRVLVEAAFYAQFPEIEIYEVPDYASLFTYNPEYHKGIYYVEYAYSRTDRAHSTDTYQIKSYIDFELDKDPKEEYKVDPLAQILELMSTLKPNEHMWFQIMIRAPGQDGAFVRVNKSGSEAAWHERINTEINAIRAEAQKNPDPNDPDKKSQSARLTPEQQDQLEHLERHKSKQVFEVGARGIFFADNRYGSDFQGQLISVFREIWRPFRSPIFNHFAPTRGLDFDYPWQDFNGRAKINRLYRFFDAWRRRSAFYPPWEIKTNMMSVEALATLWHFPSSGVQAPGLQRIPAKKSEPPANLPTV